MVDKIKYDKPTKPPDLDAVQVGDWYWCTTEEKDWDDQDEEYNAKSVTNLYCVEHIGSNYIKFDRYEDRYSTSFRLHFDDFEQCCTREDNWKDYFAQKMDAVRKRIEQKTRQLITLGRGLQIIHEDRQDNPAMLPSTIVNAPSKYKQDLVTFRDDTMPRIQDEIKELTQEFSNCARNITLTDSSKLEQVKTALSKVNDRIFTIELYAGITEIVKHIKQGEPAGAEEPICIRQQLLFMDEECLIDYDKGGMDFQSLEGFDKWVAQARNRNRIIPEQKCIVAFRVRRNKKDYGPIQSFADVFHQMAKNQANFETYLLIRNGDNLYRITTAIDFSPRLVPFKDEIGEKQFTVVHDHFDFKKHKDIIDSVEIVGPDSVDFDDHVKKQDRLIKKYNRIFILIQGILDRSQIFSPHPGIKLNSQEHMDKYIYCNRDEELGLPNNTINYTEYQTQLNKTIRKGHWIYSDWRRGYRHEGKYDTTYQNYCTGRPVVCQVTQIKRDRSAVRIVWEHDVWSWRSETGKMNCHMWIPMKEVFNLTSYNKGDYKMFLCDRALQGRYLEWAPQLLTAEDTKRVRSRFKRGN